MGLFKNIFKAAEPKEEKSLPWIPLSSLDQLINIAEKSKSKTQIIFKHSSRCGISRMVINQFVKQYPFSEEEVDLYYLDILSYRNVSDEVGYKFQVLHQSPQLIVLRNGVAVAHASHGAINAIDIKAYL